MIACLWLVWDNINLLMELVYNIWMIIAQSPFFECGKVDVLFRMIKYAATERTVQIHAGHLLIYLKRYRLSRLYCVRNFGSQSGTEILRWLHRNKLIGDGGSRDFRVLYP